MDELQIAILVHERRLDAETGKQLQETVLSGSTNFDDGQNELLKDPDAFVYRFDYDPTTHIEDLQWALEYWREEREPVPTKKPAKCRSCSYADVCSDSLV